MPDPISDVLLQAYLDLLNEVTEIYRVFGSTTWSVAAVEPGIKFLDLLPDEHAIRHGDDGLFAPQGPPHHSE